MTTTTSPSLVGADGASGVRCRDAHGRRRRAAASAARAADRAVSGRRAPGTTTTFGPRSRSHASATSAAVTSWCRRSRRVHRDAPARERGVARRAASGRARRFRARRSDRAIPPRSARSSKTLIATWTAAIGASSTASSSCARLTLQTPTRRTRPSSTSSRERAHGGAPRRSRIRRVEEVEVDRQPVERGEARFAVGPDRPGATVGHPCAARPAHAALRHDACATGCRPVKRASEEPLVAVVRPGGVEDGDSRLDRGRDRRGRAPRRSRRMQPRPTRSSSGAEPAHHGACPAARRNASSRARLVLELATRASRESGANGSSRTRPPSSDHVPATNPSTRNVAVTSPRSITAARYSSAMHAAPIVVAQHEVVEPRKESRRRRGVGRREAALAGGRGAHARARRGSASASSRSSPASRTRRAAGPSTARCPRRLAGPKAAR